jgi:hypothetical protein
LAAVEAWAESIKSSHNSYDMTNKTLICPEHYGHTLISINGQYYLLKSDKPIAELDSILNISPIRKNVWKERDSFIGKGNPGEAIASKVKGFFGKLMKK